MLSLPIYPLHPSASLGGYEWRAQELLDELEVADEDRKPYILATYAQVERNFRRRNPGRQFKPCRSPFPAPAVATSNYHQPPQPLG